MLIIGKFIILSIPCDKIGGQGGANFQSNRRSNQAGINIWRRAKSFMYEYQSSTKEGGLISWQIIL
jgi:hypothetical protein